MKYIKTYESIIRPSLDNSLYSGIYNKYLYPIELSELPDFIDHLTKIKVGFRIYENNPKFQKSGPAYGVKDCLVYFEDKDPGNVENWIKNRSFLVSSKKMRKFVGQQIKDIDLYIAANKYNV